MVEYSDLPAIVTIEDAIAKESFYPFDRKMVRGDPVAAFSTCQHVIEGDMRTGAQEHFYLETQATIAIPKGENGEMELIASTQNPSKIQLVVAKCLDVPANRIVCRVKRIGGGFGGKETRGIPISAVVAAAANKVYSLLKYVFSLKRLSFLYLISIIGISINRDKIFAILSPPLIERN